MTDYTLGPDIDLDAEEVYEPDGTRLSEQRAQDIAEDTLAEIRRGRPSLSQEPMHSPQITFRLTRVDRDRAAVRAQAEGKTLSELAREALQRYLAS